MRWNVVVLDVSDKRGSASVAATLYEETAESLAEREQTRGGAQARPPTRCRSGAPPTNSLAVVGGPSRSQTPILRHPDDCDICS